MYIYIISINGGELRHIERGKVSKLQSNWLKMMTPADGKMMTPADCNKLWVYNVIPRVTSKKLYKGHSKTLPIK